MSNDLNQQIRDEIERTKRIRGDERALKEGRVAGGLITSRGNVKQQVKSIINPALAPRNVGPLSEVAWPFFYEFVLDFTNGVDAVFTENVSIKDSVQVSQESGFLVTSLYRDWESEDLAGFGAPISLDLRDNSSSRQMNDKPIQLQHIGHKGRPTTLPLPFPIMPNASMTIKATPWISQTVAGKSGKIIIVAQGVRVRKEGMQRVMKELMSWS